MNEGNPVQVYVQPDHLWNFFLNNENRLKAESVLVAENKETGYGVYLTEDDVYACLQVCRWDNPPECEESVFGLLPLKEIFEWYIDRFLCPVTVTSDNPTSISADDETEPQFESRQEQEDIICEREDELRMALFDFLDIVSDSRADSSIDTYGESIMDEMLNDILTILSDQYGVDVYRPRFVEYPNGEEYFDEYPYNEPNVDCIPQ